MKKRFARLAAALLAVALCIPQVGAARTNQEGKTIIRIGLSSSASGSKSGELVGANLWNVEGYGSGFRFGYYDDNLNFVQLATTSKDMQQLSVIKSQNTWFKGKDRNSYSNVDNGGTVVGTYHLQLPGKYLDYNQALADASIYGGFVAWINGVYQVRVGSYEREADARAALAAIPNSSVVTTSKYGMNVIQTGTANILFQFDMGDGGRLAIVPDLTGVKDARCWFRDYQYRGGFTYQRIGGGDLTVVNVLDLEEYIKGVVPYEMGRSWPLEALKTQAVCARTYAMRTLNRHNSLGFDLCPGDHCQVYFGVGTGSANAGPSAVSDRAVEETAGKVLWYKEKLAETVYSSSHGGASENAKYVWGTDTVKEHPYLCGVVDPYEQAADNINGRSPWSVQYSTSELTKRLNDKGFGVGSSVDHMVLTYSELGNVIKLEVYWSNGQKNTYKPSDGRNSIRSVFGVNSIRFTVNGQSVGASKPQPNTYPINGTGSLNSLDGLYTIDGDGIVKKAADNLHTIAGNRNVTALKDTANNAGGTNEGGGTVTVSGSSYVFDGRGWGHQIGMSQFGAYAMAQQGWSYDKICTFYFPGTHVGSV